MDPKTEKVLAFLVFATLWNAKNPDDFKTLYSNYEHCIDTPDTDQARRAMMDALNRILPNMDEAAYWPLAGRLAFALSSPRVEKQKFYYAVRDIPEGEYAHGFWEVKLDRSMAAWLAFGLAELNAPFEVIPVIPEIGQEAYQRIVRVPEGGEFAARIILTIIVLEKTGIEGQALRSYEEACRGRS